MSDWYNIREQQPVCGKVVLGVWGEDVWNGKETTCRLLVRVRNGSKYVWRYCPLNGMTQALTFGTITDKNFPPKELYWKYIDTYFPLRLLNREVTVPEIDGRFDLMIL